MRTLLLFVLTCLFLCWAAAAQNPSSGSSELVAARILEKGPHHRIWQSVRHTTNHLGNTVVLTNSYVELASGMHYLSDGQWLESKELIELGGAGAIAQQGPHRVEFAANINTQGAIDVLTADGKRLRSHVVGLAYVDSVTGQSALIAEIKNSVGEILPPNQVIYRDAFTDFKADIRYTYRRGGFEQDVILREQPPSPSAYGLNPETTRLEVMTEFLSPPVPATSTRNLRPQNIPGEPFQDQDVDFGAMAMGQGTAFADGEPKPGRLPVGKSWRKLEERDFLLEAVEYPAIKPILDTLPPPPQASAPNELKERVASRRVVPQLKVAQAPFGELRVASISKVRAETRGAVIDYDLTGNLTNVTLKADTTYYVTGPVTFSGTNTIEGGTVVKFAATNSPSLTFNGTINNLNWPSLQYRPGIFTAFDDNSVGEIIDGSSGDPSTNANYYATIALQGGAITRIQNVRVRYAATAFRIFSFVDATHVQVSNCRYAFELSNSGTVNAKNVLVAEVDTAFKLNNSHARGEHVTVHRANYLFTQTNLTADCMFLTNSLVVAATNIATSNMVLVATSVIADETGVFQPTGAGLRYLADASPYRDIGTTSIDPSLLTALKRRTTYAPIVYSGNLSTNSFFEPRAIRDLEAPDLGYHYDPLDYAFGGVWITNNISVVIQPGVAVGTFNTSPGTNYYGLRFVEGVGSLRSVGTPSNMVRVVVFNTVQEAASSTWYPNLDASIMGSHSNSFGNFSAKFRFTEWSAIGTNTPHFRGYNVNGETVLMADNQFKAGWLATEGTSLMVTNSLFERTLITLSNAANQSFVSCTLFNGAMSLGNGLSNTWTFRNNLFDQTDVFQSGPAVHTNNAYAIVSAITNYSRLQPTNTTDVLMNSNMVYFAGPLGKFYIIQSSVLSDAGGRTADTVGLYHFTTRASVDNFVVLDPVTLTLTMQTNQNTFKERVTGVDIGFHYVAVTQTADGYKPMDTDGDGLPDYLEDPNGNNSTNALYNYLYMGSSSYGVRDSLRDSDDDGVSNLQEYLEGTDPYDAASVKIRRLGYWRFNTNSWIGEQGQMPVAALSLSNEPSWSGNALKFLTVTNESYDQLLNIDFAASGTVTGYSATGMSTQDYWNLMVPTNLSTVVTNLRSADSNAISVSVKLESASALKIGTNSHSDAMFRTFAFDTNAGNPVITISYLPAGTYDLYVYGHGSATTNIGSYTLTADNGASNVNYGTRHTTPTVLFTNRFWNEGWQYALFTNVTIAVTNGVSAQIALVESNGMTVVNGLQIRKRGNAALLRYRDAESSGGVNVNWKNGSVRFWFKPEWNSTNLGGTGPQSTSWLAGMGHNPSTWWALYLDSSGSTISFGSTNLTGPSGTGPGSPTNFLSTAISMTSNMWHQLVLTYTPTNSILYFNGLELTNGVGVSKGPYLEDRGFPVGTDSLGQFNARGRFEELETFNYPLTAGEVLSNYENSELIADPDGDGIPNYRDARPYDPAIGELTISISNPANGSTVRPGR